MTSLFHKSEEALPDLSLQKFKSDRLNVVIGGLCLGYTVATALKNSEIHDLIVTEILPAVIGWHRANIIPINNHITFDKRCRFVEKDFFELVQSKNGFDPNNACPRFHAILVDIDHSSKHWVVPANSFLIRKMASQRLPNISCRAAYLDSGQMILLMQTLPNALH